MPVSSQRNTIANQDLYSHYYLHKIVNIVPYLTEIDQYSSTLIRVLCPPYCGAVIRDHCSRFHSTDEENPSEVVTSTGQWQAEPIQADCVEH